MSFKNRESRECPFKPRRNAKLGGFLTAKKREIIFMSLCSYVFFKTANYANATNPAKEL